MTRHMVVVDDVRHSFGDVAALDGVSLAVGEGRVQALLGPNGAGKTTLVRVLTTLLVPDSGRAEVAGHDVRTDPRNVRKHIALSAQRVAVDEDVPGTGNLRTFGRLMGLRSAELRARVDELLESFGLAEVAHRPVRTFSGGERRRLDLAIALLGSPQVLFLDEPTTGLDPRSRKALWQSLREMVAGGLTVLLTTQYLEEADQLADHVTVIDRGKVVAEDRPEVLKASTGDSVLSLRFAGGDEAARAQAALEHANASREEGSESVTVALRDGADVPGLLGTVYRSGLQPSHISVREPTLDDAFLMLTGQHATSRPAPTMGRRR